MVELGGRRRYSVTFARLETQPAPKTLDGRASARLFIALKNSWHSSGRESQGEGQAASGAGKF